MGQGLQFRNVDLHVHSPASRCFKESDVTPEAIVKQALDVGMDVIAITDHNSAAWIDRIQAAAQDTALTVFPGVEITVTPGVHVIALFPTHRSGAHVEHLLSELGLGPDERGKSQALVTRYGIQEVVHIIKRHGALPVLAHIDSVKGAWHELSGQTLVQLWQKAPYAAVEIIGSALPNAVGRPPYTRQPAYYWASDNPHPEYVNKHSHMGIGTRYSCFKLDNPITWEGLRQCFDDPEVRIYKGGTPRGVPHPILERIQILGGFLAGLDVELKSELNCIIGGRGTGKSAFLEIIRYIFDIPAKTDENARQAQSLLTSVFPPGTRGIVHFHFQVSSTRYRVERVSGHPPQVFRIGNEDTPEEILALAPADLLPLQVYGQKEIYQISLNPEFQLQLLDNYVTQALTPLKEEEVRLRRQLRANAEEILRLENIIADSQESLVRLSAIQEEIRRMEALNFGALVKEKELYEQEKRVLTSMHAQVADWQKALATFATQHKLDLRTFDDTVLADLPNITALQAQRELLEIINVEIAKQLDHLKDSVACEWAKGTEQRDSLQALHTQQEQAYQKVLRQLSAEEQIAPERYSLLKQREATLQTRAHKVAQYGERLKTLKTQRQTLLEELRKVRQRQYQERCKNATQLSAKLDKRVYISLWPGGNRQVYKKYLRELFVGLRVRSSVRDKLADIKAAEPERPAQGRPFKINDETRYPIPEIPRYLDPIDLAAAIRIEQERADDAPSTLKDDFGVKTAPMRRNMAGLSYRQLFELELFTVPDLPIIELQVAKGAAGRRSLERLSIGQKCTTLLSMVLLESDTPLLIDQPEDDLDNQFIFTQIVDTLRREKAQRQFLIATHNANIPVSGDAELNLVFEAGVPKDKGEEHGWIAADGRGSIDIESIKEYVTLILEGGADAFRKRKEKYGKIIEDNSN